MAKLSIDLQGRADEGLDRGKHDGPRGATYDNIEPVDIPRAKKKQLVRNKAKSENQGAMIYPHDYIDKMHVSKSNWLSRMERGRER